MAINGTLSDIGFVSLLQFPNSSRKTGLLTVISIDGKAEFFYRKGNLIHARYGKRTGKDALVEIVDWNEGQFSFEPGVEPPETSIEDDLHHVLMWALKERDERKNNAPDQAAVPPVVSEVEQDPELSGKLEELRESSSEVQYLCALDGQGRMVACSSCEEEFMKVLEPILESVKAFVDRFPQDCQGKAFIESDNAAVALAELDGNRSVVIATGPGIRLGRLSMALGRISRSLGGED